MEDFMGKGQCEKVDDWAHSGLITILEQRQGFAGVPLVIRNES